MRVALRMGAGVVFAWLAFGAAPAAAEQEVTVMGAISIAWHGNPTRGCAASGLCGVSGTLEIASDGSSAEGSAPVPIELSAQTPVVRVSNAASDGSVSQCSDIAPVDISFKVVRSAGTRSGVIDRNEPTQLPSAGRCAGPTGFDLARLRLPAHRLGALGWDFNGSETFGAGPFTVTVVSTLRAHVRSVRRNSGFGFIPPPPPPGAATFPKPRTVLVERVRLRYAISRSAATLGTTFSGQPAPSCIPAGACGTTGRLSNTIRVGVSTLSFTADRIVARPESRRVALADVRAGRTVLSDTGDALAVSTVTSEVTQGAGTCADHGPATALPLSSHAANGVDTFLLDAPSAREAPFGSASGADLLRTRCAGPTSSVVLGNRSLAFGGVAIARLGDRALTLLLRSRGAFDGGGYAGTRQGTVALHLALHDVVVTARRMLLFPGEQP